MISYDKAKQLKELGFKWKPKRGDWYKADCWPTPILLMEDNIRLTDNENINRFKRIGEDDNNVWLPRLDQMLNKIKEYNWEYALFSENIIEIETRNINTPVHERLEIFKNETIDDVVADALIWILTQCKK